MNFIDEQLFAACESGSLKNAKTAIAQGANVNARNHHQFIPLHIAARAGHVEIIEHLLNFGASIEAKNKNHNTCLHSAAYGNQPAAITKLLQKGANAEAVNKDGDTPLHSAAWKGNAEAVITLIQNKVVLNPRNNDGDSPLHLATWNNHVQVMSILIIKQAAIEATSDKGETPLHLAVIKGNAEAFWVLVKNGANLEANTNEGHEIFSMPEWKNNLLPNMINLFHNFLTVLVKKFANHPTAFDLDFYYFLNKQFLSIFSVTEVHRQLNLNIALDLKTLIKSQSSAANRLISSMPIEPPNFQKEIGQSLWYQEKCSMLLRSNGFFKVSLEPSASYQHLSPLLGKTAYNNN